MTDAAQPNQSMLLWDQVSKTDPNHTKQFTRGGGFSGTAINSTYLIREATRMWGPMGLEWNATIVDEQIMQGAPFLGADDKVIGHELIHMLRVRVTYPVVKEGTETRYGFIEHFGQTTFVGMNKRGFFTDEEAPKKSLTDAIGKALSMLGFAADIYMGMFDDQKYVADRKAEADGERTLPEKKAKPEPKVDLETLETTKKNLASCKTKDELRSAFDAIKNAPLKAAVKEYATSLSKNLA